MTHLSDSVLHGSTRASVVRSFDGAYFASVNTVSPGGAGSETVIGKIAREDGNHEEVEMHKAIFIKKGCGNPWFQSAMMSMAAACVIGLPGAAISGATAATQATYYVSPSGDDANIGILAAPFRTMTKARDIVQTVNKNMIGDIIVYLRGGMYAIDSTISIGTSCSGTNGYTVKFINYPGETPVISGGQAITGWTVSDAAKNIYQANGVSLNFRQLYVNGVKAVRARTPNLLRKYSEFLANRRL